MIDNSNDNNNSIRHYNYYHFIFIDTLERGRKMAKFKIKLLTPLLSDQDTIYTDAFLEAEITSFNNKSQTIKKETDKVLEKCSIQNFSHTYDEEVSFHLNSQKELKFKMNRKIMIAQGWIENPYARNVHIGTIISLEDKDDNITLFIVKDMQYQVKENNIVYSITCQDLFSYQLARQSQNYHIDNDEKSSDFIGAYDINYWAKKVADDCKIIYSYVETNQGVYVDEGNKPHIYNEVDVTNGNVKDFKKQIKNIYNDKVYNRPFVFSLDKSSSSQALIKLAEQLNMNLVAREFIENAASGDDVCKIYNRLFWFEPKKKTENYTGIKYSPYNNIQDFSFSHKGNSLTTVLDVAETKDVNGKIITMLPQLTSFWKDYFLDSSLWNEKNTFINNYFKNIVDEQEITISTNNLVFNKEGVAKFKVPKLYSRFNFISANKNLSYVEVTEKDSGKKTRYTPLDSQWTFTIKDQESEDQEVEIGNNSDISKFRNKQVDLKLIVKHGVNSTIDSKNFSDYFIKIFLKRDYTKEDMEFAEMADKMPWLENKIIDFNYFLDQNLVTKYEYAELLNILQNKMRVLNGKILAYSDIYFKAMQDKVDSINKILIDFDAFGGAVQENIITPIEISGSLLAGGKTLADMASDFNRSYNQYYRKTKNTTPIIDYDKTITEYFNKYFNAQQGFLKHLYEFKEYFNKPVAQTGYINKYYYTIKPAEESNSDNSNLNLSFATDNTLVSLESLTETSRYKYYVKDEGEGKLKSPKTQFFVNEDGNFEVAKIVTEENYQDLYVETKIQEDSLYKLKDEEQYDPSKIYGYFEGDNFIKVDRNQLINEYIKKKELVTHTELSGNLSELSDPDSKVFGYDSEYAGEVKKEWLQKVAADGEVEAEGVEAVLNSYSPLNKIYTENSLPVYVQRVGKDNTKTWVRVNSLNQTSDRYLNYLKTKYWDGLTNIAKVENPVNYTKKYEYNVANSINCSNFYKRVSKVQQGWSGTYDASNWGASIGGGAGAGIGMAFGGPIGGVVGGAIGAGVGLIAGFVTGYITSSCTAWSGNNWDTGGECKWNFLKNDDENIINGNGFQWKSSNLVYTSTPNDYQMFVNKDNQINTDFKTYVDNIESYNYIVVDSDGNNAETGEKIELTTGSQEVEGKPANSKYRIYKKEDENWNKDLLKPLILNWKVPTIKSLNQVTDDGQLKYNYIVYEKILTIEANSKIGRDEVFKDGEKYIYIVLKNTTEDDGPFYTYIENKNSLNSIKDYWILANFSTLNAVKDKTISSQFKLDNDTVAIVYKMRDYAEEKASAYKEGESYYSKSSRLPFDFYKEKIVLAKYGEKELYKFPAKDILIKYSNVKGTKPNKDEVDFYYLVDNNDDDDDEKVFKKAYSINKEGNSKKLYVLDGGVYSTEDFSTSDTNPGVVAFNIVARDGVEEKAIETVEIDFSKLGPDAKNTSKFSITVNDVEYSAEITFYKSSQESTEIKNLTNGEFWFLYHSFVDKKKLFEISASIESELSSHWNQAFTYSKSCEYFIPKFWQPCTSDGKPNYFSNLIYSFDTEPIENSKFVKIKSIKLSNTLIPDIQCEGEKLSQYLRFNLSNSTTQDENNQSKKPVKNLNNSSIKKAISFIGFDLNNWTGENVNGKTDVFYFADSGGRKWRDLVEILNLDPENYEYFSGQYVTLLKQLKDNYIPYELSEYDTLIKNKNNLWRKIYTEHSNLILENKYNNDTITSSNELYEAAKLYLDEYNNPERQYNITIIDNDELIGYKDQELTIGDPIEINADEFYDEYDDVKATLREKLYISDISYNLRKDNDIKLTVNDIKYEDKVMKKLVSLIG